MKLEQLNEFNIFKKTKKTIAYSVKNYNIKIELPHIKISIVNFNNEYRFIVNANVFSTKIYDKSLKDGLIKVIKYLDDLTTTAKNGKTETAPADLPKISIDDFNITQMESDLK